MGSSKKEVQAAVEYMHAIAMVGEGRYWNIHEEHSWLPKLGHSIIALGIEVGKRIRWQREQCSLQRKLDCTIVTSGTNARNTMDLRVKLRLLIEEAE